MQLTGVASKVERWVERALIVGNSAAELRCCKQTTSSSACTDLPPRGIPVTARHMKHFVQLWPKTVLGLCPNTWLGRYSSTWEHVYIDRPRRLIPSRSRRRNPYIAAPLRDIQCLRNLSWVLLSCLRRCQVQLRPRFLLLLFPDNRCCSTLNRLLRLVNRVPCLGDNGFGFCDIAPSSYYVTFNTHRAFILALSDRLVVEADDHTREVVSGESCQSVVDKPLGRFLRVLYLANQINGLLVRADVPQLCKLVYVTKLGWPYLRRRKPKSGTRPGLPG